MKRDWNVIPGLRYSVLLVSVLLISACAAKLVDIDKSLPKLNLSEEQSEVVQPKMVAIKEIVDQYNAEKEELEEEMSNRVAGFRRGGMGRGMGGGMGRRGGGGDRSKLRGEFEELRRRREEFLKKREAYLSAIGIHIADIKAVLNEEQLAAFEKMKLPELEMPEMPGRGGGRGGGRPGGGMGGGGRRPGGGMF